MGIPDPELGNPHARALKLRNDASRESYASGDSAATESLPTAWLLTIAFIAGATVGYTIRDSFLRGIEPEPRTHRHVFAALQCSARTSPTALDHRLTVDRGFGP